MLAIVTRYSTINRFLRSLAIGDGIEFRRLARSGCATPMDHIAVIAAVSVQSQRMICEEAPTLSVGRHRTTSRRARSFRQFGAHQKKKANRTIIAPFGRSGSAEYSGLPLLSHTLSITYKIGTAGFEPAPP